MPNETEVSNVPVLHDHERRITTLETTLAGVTHEMRDLKSTVEKSGDEQKELLNTLIEHHLATNKIKLNNFWKFLITLVGGGSFLYVLFEMITRSLGVI